MTVEPDHWQNWDSATSPGTEIPAFQYLQTPSDEDREALSRAEALRAAVQVVCEFKLPPKVVWGYVASFETYLRTGEVPG